VTKEGASEPATDRNADGLNCRVLSRWKIIEFALFGSVLRDDFHSDSDVDILVEFAADAPWSLFDWTDMIDELGAIFGRKVDFVSKKGLRNPFRRQNILSTHKVIYAVYCT
jgi:uncharacterized protein